MIFTSPCKDSPRGFVREMAPSCTPAAAEAAALESAVKLVEGALQSDSAYPLLVDQFAAYGPLPSCSGLQDLDYPADPCCAAAPAPGASTLLRRVPLPAELVEQAAHAQMQCRLGLFPEIGRAWLAVDSDLFVWRYETGDDLAYFDGLSEAILAVGLVHPQPGVFQRQIHSLLCLATCTEIVILGATLQGEELLLLPEPVFTLSADGAPATCVVGSASGRIFLGGRDGCLYEIVYSAGSSWFGSRCRKVNHSSSTLAYLLPAFLSLPFGEEDPIVQVVVDDGRKALYTRSERGTLQLFDLGVRGDQASRVISLQLHQLVQMASRVAPTVDTDNFRVLVHIQVIPPAESPQAHLVVITQTGVRLYLTTISHGGPEARPSTLALLHVRLPPGFTSHAPPQRVRAVRTALCHRGTTVLVAAHTEDKDVFWTLAADAYPFQPCFMESSTFGPVDAGVCCLASVSSLHAPQPQCTISMAGGVVVPSDPPAVVTQHMEGPHKFVLLSRTSCSVYEKPRPVDTLRGFLQNPATSEEAVRAFFSLHGEVQASAICLILACNPADVQLAERATQALLRYGGEAKLVEQQPASSFLTSPVWASTPLHGGQGRPLSSFGSPLGVQPTRPHGWRPTGPPLSTPIVPQQSTAEVVFSGRHGGCYVYFSRLVRPLWTLNLVSPAKDSGAGNLADVFASSIAGQDVENYLQAIISFKRFLAKLVGSSTESSFADVGAISRSRLDTDTSLHLREQIPRKAQAEATSREWASLGQLLQLVTHTAELLGLWKVLCDHQFRAVSAAFPPDLRDQLRNATLRELVLADRQLPAGLAAALVQTYLEDNAAAEAVSNRLRSVCPSLYRIEDALFTRAHEKLLAARTERNAEERRKLLDEALTLCKQVGPQLPLGTACGLLTSCGHHAGVIDLSLSLAKQRDPQGLALHFYRQGERPEDERGRQAYGTRLECYQVIRDMLSELRATSGADGSSYEAMLSLALRSDDETFHASLYDWLCESGQSARLLDVRSPFLEAYLQRRCDAADLLWKYHERVGNYGAAARILAKLADRPGADATLARRLEYLARAIVCVKSTHFQVTNAAHEGNFLHQLEEKLEVARLQAKVRDALLLRPDLPMATELAARLDAELVDVTHLYGEYADPYDLAECKLAIVRSSGYDKPLLVESLWQSLLEREFHENARPDQLSQRLESLAREYAPSEKFFPLAFLVKFLELRGSQHGFEPGWILEPLLGAHVSISRLRDAYNDLYRGKDPAFAERSLHLLRAIARLIGLFLEGRNVEGVERRRLANRCVNDIPGYLIDLQSTAAGDETVISLIGTFKELQASLDICVAN